MYRQSLAPLLTWHNKSNRKPLVLRGARQVGKSTLVRLFAQQQKLNLIELNLEVHRELSSTFESFDIEKIILSIESITSHRIKGPSLLFLDEIQAVPSAIAALRYFYELRPDIAVIAAGSLLEFTLSKHNFSMPVGRIEYLYLEPMSFEEFLTEIDPIQKDILSEFSPDSPFENPVHEKLLQRQREYMLIGGMPEAVKIYSETQSFDEVSSVQNSIANTYIDDFAKYAKEAELINLQTIFRTIPKTIGNKLKYVNLLPDEKSAATRKALDLLLKAQVVRRIQCADGSGVPLAVGASNKVQKLLFLDCGLVARLLQTDYIDLSNFNERSLINEGPFAEQFIGQHLNLDPSQQTAPEKFYWAREGKGANAEVDFLISKGNLILPIEVKAGRSGSLKSLHHFMYLKSLKHAIRFDMQPPSIQRISTSISLGHKQEKSEYTLISLPLYAIDQLPKVVDQLRAGNY